MRVLPARVVAPDGTSKQRVLAVLREVARIDFRNQLAGITARTLVLCGSKDVANLPAARALAAGIPGARLRVIEGAGGARCHPSHAVTRTIARHWAGPRHDCYRMATGVHRLSVIS